MQVFLVALAVFAVAVLGMSIGALLSGRCMVKGSCGGLNTIRDRDGKPMCEACRATPPEPETPPAEGEPADAAEDTTESRAA